MWSKSASPAQLGLEQIVKPQEQVIAPEVRDRAEYPGVETEARVIQTASTF